MNYSCDNLCQIQLKCSRGSSTGVGNFINGFVSTYPDQFLFIFEVIIMRSWEVVTEIIIVFLIIITNIKNKEHISLLFP